MSSLGRTAESSFLLVNSCLVYQTRSGAVRTSTHGILKWSGRFFTLPINLGVDSGFKVILKVSGEGVNIAFRVQFHSMVREGRCGPSFSTYRRRRSANCVKIPPVCWLVRIRCSSPGAPTKWIRWNCFILRLLFTPLAVKFITPV